MDGPDSSGVNRVATGEREPAHRPTGRGSAAHGPMIASDDHWGRSTRGRRRREGKGRGGAHRVCGLARKQGEWPAAGTRRWRRSG